MKSTRMFVRKEMAAVVTVVCTVIASLSAASGQSVDQCDPSSVMGCYVMYMTVLWPEESFKTSSQGEHDEEALKKSCSRMKEKLPCHQYLANCSEEVTGRYGIQERGYEAMRNIICDINKLKEYHKAVKCIDVEKMEECVKTSMPTSNPQDAGKPAATALRCHKNPVDIGCFDKAFNSGFLVLLVATVILSSLRT
ncbi:hypothetical protein MTO96_035278 [Rhipicephalus appendiculatus]